ncbi:MAG TPA: hypothetical protein VIM48_06515 [Chthoniobacterales bacterium]
MGGLNLNESEVMLATNMPELTDTDELEIERAIRKFVLEDVKLGIYDPNQFRRPAVAVVSFEIEVLEWDGASSVAHAAGPVVLRPEEGEIENYLRISLTMEQSAEGWRVAAEPDLRAAYIVDMDHPSGACKETAALANA